MKIPVSQMEKQRCSASYRSGILLEWSRAISNSASELQALQSHLSTDMCKDVSFNICRSQIHLSANGLGPWGVQPDHPFLFDEWLSVNIWLCVLCFWNYNSVLFSLISKHHLLFRSQHRGSGWYSVSTPCSVKQKYPLPTKRAPSDTPSFPSSSQHLFHAASHKENSEEAQEWRSFWREKSLGAWRPLAALVLLSESFQPGIFCLIIYLLVFIYYLSISYPSLYLFFCWDKSDIKFTPLIVESHIFLYLQS